MVTTSGFIILDEEFFHSFPADLSSYRSCLNGVLVPRILDSRTMSSIHILFGNNFSCPIDEASEKSRGEIFCIAFDGNDSLAKILEIARNKTADEIVFISPKNLFTSPEEIDKLVLVHCREKRTYSFNHERYANNHYATGVGAEVINTSFLRSLKYKDNELKRWADLHTARVLPGDNGIICADDQNAAPEINLSIRSAEDFQKILHIIGRLRQKSPDPRWILEEIFRAYRSLHSVRTVFLLERSEDVLDALKWAGQAGGDVDYVSLSPLVTAALERAGLPFSTRERFITSAAINSIGQRNYGMIGQLGKVLNPFLEKKPCGNTAYFRLDYCLYNLKYLYDLLTVSTHVISEIIRIEQPDSIRIFSPAPAGNRPGGYQFTNEESIYAQVLSLPDWNVPVTILERGRPQADCNQSPQPFFHCIYTFFSKCLKGNSLFFNYWIILRKNGFPAVVKTFFRQVANIRGKMVAIYGSGYNWDDCLPELFGSGIGYIFRIDAPDCGMACTDTEGLAEALAGFIRNDDMIRESAMHNGIDFSPVLFPRVIALLTESWYRCQEAYIRTSSFFKHRQVRALLLSVRPTPEGHAIIAAARSKGIPVISWQHGGLGYNYHPIAIFIELMGSDIHLVFGDCVKKSYLETCRRYPYPDIPTIIPVGSSSLDKIGKHLLESIQQDTKTILYVTTLYEFNIWYVSIPYIADNFNESLWSFQKGVINTVMSAGRKKLTLKLHPLHTSKEPIISYVREQGYQMIDIHANEKTVPELLADSGILIFDHISTGILQALCTRRELFVYTGLMKVDDFAIALLKKRAHVYNTKEECLSALTRYLSGASLNDGADCANTEFLKCYGTHLNDGCSGKRAVEIVKNAINGEITRNE